MNLQIKHLDMISNIGRDGSLIRIFNGTKYFISKVSLSDNGFYIDGLGELILTKNGYQHNGIFYNITDVQLMNQTYENFLNNHSGDTLLIKEFVD